MDSAVWSYCLLGNHTVAGDGIRKETKMPKDPTKKRVNCKFCKGRHYVTKGAYIVCPKKIDSNLAGGAYIFVDIKGRVTQERDYEKIRPAIEKLRELIAQKQGGATPDYKSK